MNNALKKIIKTIKKYDKIIKYKGGTDGKNKYWYNKK